MHLSGESVVNRLLSKTFTRSLGFALVLVAGVLPAVVHAQSTLRRPADTTTESDTNTLPSHIAIRVESETVPMETFRGRVETLVSQYERKAKKQGKKFDPEKVRKRFENRIKRKMISRLLLDVHSRRENVQVPEEKFQKIWENIIERTGSLEEYRKKMKKQGLSLEEAKRKARTRLRRRQYIQEQITDVSVSDTEIRKVYMNHRERFKRVGRKRAVRFIRKQILKKKENQASRVFINKLKQKSLVQTNV